MDVNLSNQKKEKKSVGILNLFYTNTNYGANLVAYSLQEIVKKLGFDSKIINFNPSKPQNNTETFLSFEIIKFKQKFLNRTIEINKLDDLFKMNLLFDSFITGSDQVWNLKIIRDNYPAYFLKFADTSKNIISYAASLGNESITCSQEITNQISSYLKRFDAISVREPFAVDLIKKSFNPNTEPICVLDPTLLLEANDYQKIIDSEDLDDLPEKYVAFYFLNDRFIEEKYHKSESYIKLIKKLNLPDINCYGETIQYLGNFEFKFNSVSKWLNTIKNSSLVFTDSFHGICFSIIFNKNFIFINKDKKLSNRISSLLEKLNIQDRTFEKFEDIDILRLYNSPINYYEINQRLKIEKSKSVNYLSNALNKSLDKDFMLIKLSKSLDEKNEEIENLKKTNILEISKNIKTYLKLLLWNCWLWIFRRLPAFLQDFIRTYLKKEKY